LGFNFSASVNAANAVTATRVWPAQDYTRITLESAQPFVYKMSIIQNPDRVVVDIENIDLNQVVKSLSDKILASDPYIKQIRVAKFQQNVVRLVVDLKTEAKPNAFTLTPTGDYKHRLVLDVYPLKDPLMAMIEQRDAASNSAKGGSTSTEAPDQVIASEDASDSNANQPEVVLEPLPPEYKPPEPVAESKVAKSTKPAEAIKPADAPITKDKESSQTAAQEAKTKKNGRQIVIAIDAGHGGEDPGARGATGSREKDVTLMIAKRLKEKIDNEPNMRAVLHVIVISLFLCMVEW